jgi:hypothetical protein
MSCELRRDDDLLLQPGFLLSFKWIIDIFVEAAVVVAGARITTVESGAATKWKV